MLPAFAPLMRFLPYIDATPFRDSADFRWIIDFFAALIFSAPMPAIDAADAPCLALRCFSADSRLMPLLP